MSTPTLTLVGASSPNEGDAKFVRRLLAQLVDDATTAVSHYEAARRQADADGDYFGLRHQANDLVRTLESVRGTVREFLL